MHQVFTILFIFLTCWYPAQSGFACLSNPCVHGVCLDDLNTTYSCYCVDGYTGVQCQTNWDECWSSPCQNGGLCLDGIAAFNCTCPPGFVGEFCEENLNECLSNPCQNNATCLDAANGYFCNCMPGYSGIHCELDIAVCNLTNETRCLNGGRCLEGPGVTFSCRCAEGWIGFLCEMEVDECLSHPCQNGALCVDLHADYECACPFGYAGRQCEETVMVCDDNPCRNDALCLMEDEKPVCYCVPDYHGDRCQFQYDECKLSTTRCLNGGSCIDGIDGFTCSCPPSLTGMHCECLILDIKGGIYLDCSYTAAVTQQVNQTVAFATTSPSHFTTETEFSTTSLEVPKTDATAFSSTSEPSTPAHSTEQVTITTESSTESSTSSVSLSTTEDNTISTIRREETSERSSSTSIYTSSTKDEATDITTDRSITPSSTNIPITEAETEIDTTPFSMSTYTTESASSSSVSPDSAMNNTVDETTTTTSTPQMNLETTTELLTTEIDSTSSISTKMGTMIFTELTTISTTTESLSSELTVSSEVSITETTTEASAKSSESSTITKFTSALPTDLPLSTFTEPESTESSTEISLQPFDCSKSNQRCQNGGTCVYTGAFACICPYDFIGQQCETMLGIRSAAFGGHSYVIHQIQVGSRIKIAFTAQTTSAAGLLFHSTIGDTYMALYIEQGHLKFKFSCGFQTMLLSELNKPFNNGYDMRISALLTFSDDRLHCNASIKLNDTLTMSGAQLAKIEQFFETNSAWLYLGGSNERSNPVAKIPGFVGCISDLMILDKGVRIFNDAENGYGISECSSLACLSAPCQNGGTCSTLQQEIHRPRDEMFICTCPNGFIGSQCESSVCDNNPCLFGGTCLPYTGSGFICLCPYGKHGQFCENELKISRLQFANSIQGYSSYTAYQIPKNSYKSMKIRFKIAPSSLNQISLLMFMGQHGPHDFYSDHMAVSFIKGYIMLTWNLGAGPRRIFTSTPIPVDKSHYEIEVGRHGRQAWLHVEYLGNVTGRSQGTFSQLDVEPVVFFGGYRSKDFEGLPHDLPLHSGFSGCIYDMEFKIGDVTIALGSGPVFGRAVGQCGTTECYEGICQNMGACLYHGGTFTCLCQEGFFGPLCSLKFNPCNEHSCGNGGKCQPMIFGYECDCPLGYKGKYCRENETLSDVSFTGIRSFILLSPQRMVSPNKFHFDLELRPIKDGLIAFIGSEETFFSLSLLSGLLELRILASPSRTRSQDILMVRSNKLLRGGVWHQIRVQIYGRKVYLFVDNIVNTAILQTGDILDLSREVIYLGGLPDLSKLPLGATSELPNWFAGCMRKLFIEHVHISLNLDTIVSAQNVEDCDGSPCGGDHCHNGGSCWLDPNLTPRCNCLEPFYGTKCENAFNCSQLDRNCNNDGYCVDGRCVCKLGYAGALCETGLTIKSPKFAGRSYLFVNIPHAFNASARVNRKRNLLGTKHIRSNVQIEFSTASDGLLLYSNGTNETNVTFKLFAMGISNGKLTLINSNLNTVQLFGGPILTDGFRHQIDLNFDPLRVYIDAQEFNITGFESIQFSQFFLGSVPANFQDSVHLTPVFGSNGFNGCLDGVLLAHRQVEFNTLQGENIEDCSIDGGQM